MLDSNANLGSADESGLRRHPGFYRLPQLKTNRGRILKEMSEDLDAFEVDISIEPADIDEMGHVNNVTYLRWVQGAAAAHWKAIAPAADQTKLAWIVLHHEIDYKQPAYLGDRIIARTWVGAASRVRFERHTEVLRAGDRSLLAKARSVWCPIDVQTKRPVSVGPEVRARFSRQGSPAGRQPVNVPQ